MEKQQVIQAAERLFPICAGNQVAEEVAISAELAGLTIFEAPLVGIGSAQDPLFQTFLDPAVIGPWFKQPQEWLEGAQTVVSFFFPFTEEIRRANRKQTTDPSAQWLHGRIEGEAYLHSFITALGAWFEEQGIRTCAPMTDSRFLPVHNGNRFHEYGCVTEKTFGSNWSERHIAYLCGLGTFGLSKGLITEKGMAGRFTSIILDEKILPDERPYTEVYEYCIHCGACIRRCPAGAITEQEKDHTVCRPWLLQMAQRYAPRYGCGLCQTGVPCESRNPSRKK